MTQLTIVQPYYRNPGMLELLLDNFQRFPAQLKSQIEWILIDDHSPEAASEEIEFTAEKETKARMRLLIVDDDITWNQHGARNLGAREARSDWLLMNDMDRLMVEDDMEMVIGYIKDGKMSPAHHYKPRGMKMKCTSAPVPWGGEKPIVNQFFCTKDAYWKCGGYDEDYCGLYGGDGPLLRELERKFPLKVMRDCIMFRYDRHVVPDSTTQDLDRERGGYAKLAKTKQREGRIKPINPIRFKWHEEKIR